MAPAPTKNFDWLDTIKPNLQCLRAVGLWPKDDFYKLDLYLLYGISASILTLITYNLCNIINIFYVYTNLEELIDTVFLALTNVLAMVKIYFFLRNLKTIKKLFVKLNSEQFRPKNAHQVNVVEPSLKTWRNMYVGYSILVYGASCSMVTMPIVNKWRKIHKLPYNIWYPFNVTVSPNYELGYLWESVSYGYITVANLNMDTIVLSCLMLIWAQCELLSERLRNLDDAFSKELVDCIKHHQEILSFAEDSNNFFNMLVFGQMVTSNVAIALTMFQLSVVDRSNPTTMVPILGYFCGISTQILLYCWFGNEVEVKSEKIPYSVFESKWTDQSESTKRSLLIFCINCDKPIKISALNIFPLSLGTYVTIMRSAFSYYTMLTEVNSK